MSRDSCIFLLYCSKQRVYAFKVWLIVDWNSLNSSSSFVWNLLESSSSPNFLVVNWKRMNQILRKHPFDKTNAIILSWFFWKKCFSRNTVFEFKKCNPWKFDDHTSCKAACFSDVNKPFKWEYSASASKLSISLSNFRLAIASVSLKIFSLCRFAFSCNEIYSNWFFYKKLEILLLRRRISFARHFSYGVFFSELLTKNNFTRWNKRKRKKKYKNSIHLPCRVSIVPFSKWDPAVNVKKERNNRRKKTYDEKNVKKLTIKFRRFFSFSDLKWLNFSSMLLSILYLYSNAICSPPSLGFSKNYSKTSFHISVKMNNHQ